MKPLHAILEEQQQYYDDRAPEYDDWWYRRNVFDEGVEENVRWRAEAAIVEAALDATQLGGDVLELAAGTGVWSARLLQSAASLTLVDGSARMLAHNPVAADARVTSVQADIFKWHTDKMSDSVFFGFWISHVPRELFVSFIRSVSDRLRPGGKFFFVDNRLRPEVMAPHVLERDGEFMKRKLMNGKVSTIVKNYYTREEISDACKQAGLYVEVRETLRLFQYGFGLKE